MNTRSIITTVVAALLSLQNSFGETKATVEGAAIRNILSGMYLFQKQNEGRIPKTWEDVGKFLDLMAVNKTVAGTAIYPIEEHYVFVTNRLVVPSADDVEDHVILLRTSSVVENEERTGRYLISTSATGLRFTWLDENKVQQMFAEAGITEMPKPDIRSGPKEQSPVRIPPSVNSTPGQTAPSEGKKPQVTGQDLPNPSASTKESPMVSNTIPSTIATTTPVPGSGTSWFGLIVVLGMGLLAGIFLLFRTKQK